MDVLSEALKAVKLDGAVFFNGEFSSPWCAREPDAGTMASYLPVRPKRVIIFHLVTDGRGYVRVEENGRAVPLQTGDIVIIPHGHAHFTGKGPSVAPIDSAAQLRQVLAEGRMLSQHGGEGEITKLVCGYLTCDPQLSQVFPAGLPPIVVVTIRDSPSEQWLEDTFRYSVDHVGASGPGGAAVIAKLSEVLFVETLRRYIAQLQQTQTGWRAGGAIRTWERRWRSCTNCRPTPGQSPRWPTKSVCLAPCGRAISALSVRHADEVPDALEIAARRSSVGVNFQERGRSSERRGICMSPSRPSIAPSNGNSGSRRRDSAARHDACPSNTRRRRERRHNHVMPPG